MPPSPVSQSMNISSVFPAVMTNGDRADGGLHRRQRPVELHRHGIIQTQFGHTALRHGIAADGVIGLAVLPFVQHSERHHRVGLFGIARFYGVSPAVDEAGKHQRGTGIRGSACREQEVTAIDGHERIFAQHLGRNVRRQHPRRGHRCDVGTGHIQLHQHEPPVLTAQERCGIAERTRHGDIVVARIPEITHREVVERRGADIAAGRQAIDTVRARRVHHAPHPLGDTQGFDARQPAGRHVDAVDRRFARKALCDAVERRLLGRRPSDTDILPSVMALPRRKSFTSVVEAG